MCSVCVVGSLVGSSGPAAHSEGHVPSLDTNGDSTSCLGHSLLLLERPDLLLQTVHLLLGTLEEIRG